MNMFVVLSFVSVVIFNINTAFGQEIVQQPAVVQQQPAAQPAQDQNGGPNYQLSGTFLLAPSQTVMDPVYVLPENTTGLVQQQQQAPSVPYILVPQQIQTPYMGQQYPQFYTILNQQQATPVSYPQVTLASHYDAGAINKQIPAAPAVGYYPQFVQTAAPGSSGNPQQLFIVRQMKPGMNKVYPATPDASATPCQLLRQNAAAQNQFVLAPRQ
ncbi:uncharacterized protein LOC112904159 [Agrilus planipennis]|uniref:Uncharacterized protein LOC108733445 n=1 Tax=Agrilus planipennis TaxID=224129 RepID=A0A1W4W7Q6_AGRPL|nr:uncharacterized protein LOC108733445 [Agrilus planipennis]XP_025829330.1 uncharacterized protein LOC112904159 [Agrilus planipennis]